VNIQIFLFLKNKISFGRKEKKIEKISSSSSLLNIFKKDLVFWDNFQSCSKAQKNILETELGRTEDFHP